MSSKSIDNFDVSTLLDRSDLDPTSYRTFTSPEALRQVSKTASQSKQVVDHSIPSVEQEDALPTVAHTVARTSGAGNSAVVEAATRMLSRSGSAPTDAAATSWDKLPVDICTAFAGVVGGAGTTTILANVAAALVSYGETIVLADRGPSLLPFYFGGRNFRAGSASFMPRKATDAGPIHLATGAADATSDDWMLHGVSEFQQDADRILMNGNSAISDEGRQWTSSAANVVLLLTPDPASLLRLSSVLERLRSAADGHIQPVFLLNQFEPNNELHIDIRSSMSKQFGEHLLPFVVRRDPAFARCLAAGGTVPELAPDSNATEDIHILVEWLRNRSTSVEA